MKPRDFKESTKVLQPSTALPGNEKIGNLPVWTDGINCVSCWRCSFVERIKILFTGKVWLGVKSGKTQPAVFISGNRVFAKAPFKARFLAFIYDCKDSILSRFITRI